MRMSLVRNIHVLFSDVCFASVQIPNRRKDCIWTQSKYIYDAYTQEDVSTRDWFLIDNKFTFETKWSHVKAMINTIPGATDA
jgi:hypothetical protein